MPSIDLNCDLGEGAGHDAELMALVSSANIACGGHAGDAGSMKAALALAERNGVSTGAHPGYPDRGNFGRAEVELSPAETRTLVASQVAALAALGPVRHVKPHGALYNRAVRDPAVAAAIVAGARDVDSSFLIYCQPGSALERSAVGAGLGAVAEFFADRAYRRDGTLVPRRAPGAVIEDDRIAVERTIRVLDSGWVRAADGGDIALRPATVCLHGDGRRAVAFARLIRAALLARGWTITAPRPRR